MCSVRMETGVCTANSWTKKVSDFESLKTALRVGQGVEKCQFGVTAGVLPIQDVL